MTHEFTEDELGILASLLLDRISVIDTECWNVSTKDKNLISDLCTRFSCFEPSPARASLAAIVDIMKNYDGQIGAWGKIQEIAEAGIGPDEI